MGRREHTLVRLCGGEEYSGDSKVELGETVVAVLDTTARARNR